MASSMSSIHALGQYSLTNEEWYLVHRVDLHNYLKQCAIRTATLHMGCKIVNIDVDSPRPSVTLNNGERYEADLLLGADGLHVCTTTWYSLSVYSPHIVRCP